MARGDRVAKLREEKGYSQSDLAAMLDLGSATIARFEQGRGEPSAEVVVTLARFFNVSTDYLLGLSDVPHAYYDLSVLQLDEVEQAVIRAMRRHDELEAIRVIINKSPMG